MKKSSKKVISKLLDQTHFLIDEKPFCQNIC